MATPKDWPVAQDLGGWMRNQEKRVMHEERRPRITQASDLLGPGFGPRATGIGNWNSETARFNGFFQSASDADNVPVAGSADWLGLTISIETEGVQIAWSRANPVRTFVRSFQLPEFAMPTYAPWVEVTGGGGGEGPAAAYLDELLDVATGGSTSGDLLRYNGTEWAPSKTLPSHSHSKSQITDFGHTHVITDLPVADDGEVSATEVVRANDSRLSDARTPTTHSHTKSQITDFGHTHPLSDLTAGTLDPPLVMKQQADVPAAPAAGTGVFFIRNNKPMFRAPTGAEVDLTYVPTVVSDATAASGTITLTPIGGLGSLFFRWTEATSTDPVTYKLYVRAGQAPTLTDDTYLVAQGMELLFATVREVAGVKVDGSGATTYYATVTGGDVDTAVGAEVVSNTVTVVPAQVTGPDIAVGAVKTRLLAATEGFVDVLKATDFSAVTMTGATIQTTTDVVGAGGIRLTPTMMEAFAGGGQASFFSVNPKAGMAIVAGTINSLKLTVSGIGADSSLGGTTAFPVNAVATLANGSTAPTAAPSVSYDYSNFQFDPAVDNFMASRKGWVTDGTWWYCYDSNAGTIQRWNGTTGAIDYEIVAAANAKSTGLALLGTNLYRVATTDATGATGWRLYVYTTTAAAPNPIAATGNNLLATQSWASGVRNLTLGVDTGASELLLTGITGTVGSTQRIRFRRLGTSVAAAVTSRGYDDTFTNWSQEFSISDGAVGVLADFGGYRYVVPQKFAVQSSWYVQPFSGANSTTPTNNATAVTVENNEDWFAGGTAAITGFSYQGTTFRSVDANGVRRTYTNLWTTQPSDYEPIYVSSTLAYAATGVTSTPQYETTAGPSTLAWNGSNGSGYFPKRARLIITAPTIPARVGAQDPDRVRIYLNRAGATVYQLEGIGYVVGGAPGYMASGANVSNAFVLAGTPEIASTSLILTAWPSSSVQPPQTSSGFPGQTAAKLKATTGGFEIDGASNGSIGTGSFRNSVYTAANERVNALAPDIAVAQADARINALAPGIADTQITAYMADTGWITTGITAGSATSITAQRRRKVGKVIEVRVAGTLTSNLSVAANGGITNRTLFTMPLNAGFDPSGMDAYFQMVLEGNLALGRFGTGGGASVLAVQGTGTARTINSGAVWEMSAIFLT